MEVREAIESDDVRRVYRILHENPSLADNSLLCTAARTGRHAIVQLVISRFKCEPNMTETNEDGWTALQLAAQSGHHEVVKVLLARVLLPKRLQSDETTPTTPSSISESEMAQRAVSAIGGKWSRTALHLAAAEGHSKVVELLLPHCSESTLNAADSSHFTALSLAARGGHLLVVQLLLAEHPNPANSLELAAVSGHDEVVKLLLDHHLRLASGPMNFVVRFCHGECVRLLLKANPELLDKYFEAADSKGEWDKFLALLDECERAKGPDFVCELLSESKNSQGLTVLQKAFMAYYNCPEDFISRLMKFEWRQTSVDFVNGHTLLHDVACSKHFNSQVLEKVLAMDPTALQRTNKFHETPFDLAVHLHPKNVEVMLRYVSLDDIVKHKRYARRRVPALLEEFVRPPLLLELHSDVVGIVCDYLFSAHEVE